MAKIFEDKMKLRNLPLDDFSRTLKKFEQECLFKYLNPEEVAVRVKAIKKEFPDQQDGRLEFFEAVSWHERANQFWSGYLAHFEFQIKKMGATLQDLKVEDIQKIYKQFDQRGKLEQAEDKATELYDKSSKMFWRGQYNDTNDAKIYILDLTRRRNILTLSGEELETALKNNDRALQNVIQWMSPGGKRDEVIMMSMIRTWAREAGVAYLVDVEHGLPREDMGSNKVDYHLIVGPWKFGLQQKTEVMDDTHRFEHYEKVREKAEKATMYTTTKAIYIDSLSLAEARELAGQKLSGSDKARYTRLKKHLLGQVILPLADERRELVLDLLNAKFESKKKETEPKRITSKWLYQHADIPRLKALGLLGQNEFSAQAVLNAKQYLSACSLLISDIFGTQEAFLDPEPDMLERARFELSIKKEAA